MPDYRAHIVMGNGQNDKVIPLNCEDDAQALNAAEKLVEGHDVEVWCDYRKLGTLHHYMRARPIAEVVSIKVGIPPDRRSDNPLKRGK